MSASRRSAAAEKVEAVPDGKISKTKGGGFSAEYLEEYREMLEEMKQEAQAKANGEAPQHEHTADFADQADHEVGCHVSLQERRRAHNLVLKIEQALRRLDKGEYGICEECGGRIPKSRLKSRPFTNLCLECKVEKEREEFKKEGKPVPAYLQRET